MNTPEAVLSLLNKFYQMVAGRSPLEAELLDPEAIPDPQCDLLVHRSDMTARLIDHHGQDIELWILEKIVVGDDLYRHLVLESVPTRRPLEYGAIRIHLDVLSPRARDRVLEGRIPLGTILKEDAIQYEHRPVAFFRVFSNDLMQRAFRMKEPRWLYGRCNRLVTRAGDPIAEVVEILPPGE
jgi:chorismate-pyruvate lyase